MPRITPDSVFTVQFQLGNRSTRRVPVRLARSERHPYSLRATVEHNWRRRFARSVLRRLPDTLQDVGRRLWPLCFLPTTVLLRRAGAGGFPGTATAVPLGMESRFAGEDDAGYAEDPNAAVQREAARKAATDHELAYYARLRPLQGRAVPVCHGRAEFAGTLYLVLSDVPGPLSCNQPAPRLRSEEFERRIRVAATTIGRYGLVPSDAFLDAVVLSGDRAVFFDVAHFDSPSKSMIAQSVEWTVFDFADRYLQYLISVEGTNAVR